MNIVLVLEVDDDAIYPDSGEVAVVVAPDWLSETTAIGESTFSANLVLVGEVSAP
jgi:hypothetical protein